LNFTQFLYKYKLWYNMSSKKQKTPLNPVEVGDDEPGFATERKE